VNLLETVELLALAETKRPKLWIGVDFDGTLVVQKKFPEIGPPVEKMVRRVKKWLKHGCIVKGYESKSPVKKVKIFTARASDPYQVEVISNWTKKHLGQRLEVTNVKDSGCVRIVDNISVRVKKDKGDIEAGGPGSGRHVTVYHGLRNAKDVDSILKEGFKINKGRQQLGVFVSQELAKGVAQRYAKERQGAIRKGSNYTVLKLRIPSGRYHSEWKKDEFEPGSRYVNHNVPASYIHSVQIYKSAGSGVSDDKLVNEKVINASLEAVNKTDGVIARPNNDLRAKDNKGTIPPHPFEGKHNSKGQGLGDCKECGKSYKHKAHWRIAAGEFKPILPDQEQQTRVVSSSEEESVAAGGPGSEWTAEDRRYQ
jgi:hypothetical protein